MSYIEKSISIYSTELDFLKAFIAAMKASVAGNRITCDCTDSDLETQFEIETNTPTFTLSVDRIYTITFTRDDALTSNRKLYKVTSSAFTGYISLDFSDTGYLLDDKATRTWNFSVMANSENIYLKLARYDGNLNSPAAKWLSIKNNTISVCAVQFGSTNIMTSDFVSTGGQAYKKVDRLPYTYNASDLTKIEVINSKTFVENSTTNRAFETSKIIDSTTVTTDKIVSINSTKYYALDSNTLMEI